MKKENVRIWSVGEQDQKKNPCFFSNIPDRKITFTKEEGLVNCLLNIKNQFTDLPKILLTSDAHVVEISKRRSELEPYYRFILPLEDVVEVLMEKSSFYELSIKEGWDVPKTFTVNNLDIFRRWMEREY
ncbi:hypothetical protein [Desulfonema magnum]|uniref:hypothetical protein n=1 Tax=Desulfonema magnum TaxID=45655 RepID=UPI001A9ACBE2|nr:hypothetical protein [Desulfonema magnum]